MKRINILGLVCVFMIAFTALVPVPLTWGVMPVEAKATISKLTIDNKTGKVLTITVKGSKTYTIYALPGKTEKEIAAGKYTYAYEACGVKKTGKLSATSSKSKLKINACPTTKLLLINKSSTTLSFTLNGPEHYYWSVPPQTKMRVTVIKGKYTWSASWCGHSDKGNLDLRRAMYFMVWCSQ